MVEILSKMVEDIMKDNLSDAELQSLSQEIANHNDLLDSLRQHPRIKFKDAEKSS